MPVTLDERITVADNLEPVSWGVLSTADIGLAKVIPAMQASSLARVDAIASRSPERAARAAAGAGIARSYESYQELLGDPEIEAVYIPLPNHMHAEWTIAAAEAGKHVLCEKPLAMTSAVAREMVEVCERSGVKLMEAFMYRLHPLWTRTFDMVESGAIGELRSMRAVFSYFNNDPTNIRNIPQAGGGALYDIGCYPINSARLLFGSEPTHVKGIIERDPALGTDILTSALLDFDGRHASFTCSTQMEPDQRVDIYGTEGRLTLEIPFNIPPDEPARLFFHVDGSEPEVHEMPVADQYTIQADAFSRAIREDRQVPIGPTDAVANLEVIERIFSDAGSG